MNKDKLKSQTALVGNGMVAFSEEYKGSTTSDPADLCNRYCSMLNMDQRATVCAVALAGEMKLQGSLAGRSPLSSAAACIFMASHLMGQPKTAKEIMQVARVSDSTIRHAYRLLWGERDALLTEEIIARGADPSKLPRPS